MPLYVVDNHLKIQMAILEHVMLSVWLIIQVMRRFEEFVSMINDKKGKIWFQFCGSHLELIKSYDKLNFLEIPIILEIILYGLGSKFCL